MLSASGRRARTAGAVPLVFVWLLYRGDRRVRATPRLNLRAYARKISS